MFAAASAYRLLKTGPLALPTFPRVNDERALRHLPSAYATALRLRQAGAEDALIARALDLEVTALPAFMDLAEAKLHRLQRQSAAPTIGD